MVPDLTLVAPNQRTVKPPRKLWGFDSLPAHFQQTACAILVARHGFESTEVGRRFRNANQPIVVGRSITLRPNTPSLPFEPGLVSQGGAHDNVLMTSS